MAKTQSGSLKPACPNAIANENEDAEEDVVEEVEIDYPPEGFEVPPTIINCKKPSRS